MNLTGVAEFLLRRGGRRRLNKFSEPRPSVREPPRWQVSSASNILFPWTVFMNNLFPATKVTILLSSSHEVLSGSL
jgi:hypothetical protein